MAAVIFLTACQTTGLSRSKIEDSSRFSRGDVNVMEMTSGRQNGVRYAKAYNAVVTWQGPLAGGEEKIRQRQAYLLTGAHEEAARVCGSQDYELIDGPTFDMIDRTGNPYVYGNSPHKDAALASVGYGAIPALIASLLDAGRKEAMDIKFSKVANVPVSVFFDFICTDERDRRGNLEKRG